MAHIFQTTDKHGKHHKRWRFQYTDFKGKRRKGTGSTSKVETEKLAQRVQAEQDAIRKGYIPRPTLARTPRRFDVVAREFIQWGKAAGGIDGRPWDDEHAEKCEQKLKWWGERLRLEVVGDLVEVQADVESAVRVLLSENIEKRVDKPERFRTPQTVQRYIDPIRRFCSWCFERGYLDDDPLKRLKSLTRQTKYIRRALTRDEITDLLAHCWPSHRLLYQMALATGLRADELRSITVGHIDFDRGGIRLDAAWTKKRKAGFQYLAAGLMEQLRPLIGGHVASDPVLHVGDHPARDLDADLVRADIQKWGPGGKIDFHALRAAYSTLVDESGATPRENMELMRHATPQQTYGTYTKSRDGRLAALAELVGAAIIPAAPILHQRVANGDAGFIGEKDDMAGVHRNRTDPSPLRRIQRL